MAPKRALAASQSSQTTPSHPSSSAARPAKRPRVARSPPAPSSSLAAPPSTAAQSVVPETPDASLSLPRTGPTLPAAKPKPPKRPLVPGTLRRLSTGHPTRSTAHADPALAHPPLSSSTSTGKRARVRPAATLAGAKVGGESKDLGDRVEREELWVRRAKGPGAQGLGFAGYLKMGVGAFVERGCTSLTVNAMGAAIPLALSLALAIRDAIPGGEPPAPVPRSGGAPDGEGEAEGDEGEGIVRMSVRTGSKTVSDEVTPLDEDEDLVYQSRTKSTPSRDCPPLALVLGTPARSSIATSMLDFLFGGSSKKQQHRTPHPFPSSSSSSSAASPGSTFPPSASSSPYGADTEGAYDDVALGGGDLGGGGMASQSRNSLSGPPASDGAFVGSSSASAARSPAYPPPQQQQQQRPTHRSTPSNGYSAESSYPPLPSFSRPSSSSSTPSGGPSRSPPLHATFARLRALLAEQSPSLADTLSSPLSSHVDPALSSLRAALAPYELPRAVVDAYLQHDGQELLSGASTSGGGAAGGARVGGLGLVYGLWWMPLDQVEQEWRFWRALEDAGGLEGAGLGGDAFGASVAAPDGRRQRGGRAHPYVADEEEIGGRGVGGGKDGKGCDVPGMGAFPDGWVRKRYSHPGWLPLLTDRCGNYIGVDLDPPPPPAGATTSSSSSSAAPGAPAAKARTYGQPGQVIAFGREIDDKVVLFPGDGPAGWARFLAAFVDDVERGEFARLGERPAAGDGAGDEDEWDEERASAVQRGKAARRDSVSDGSGSEDEWRGAQDDGLGDRGYFESGVYGEEVVGSGPGARSAQTWVIRTEYRRLAAKLDLSGGVIGILCERSRRKWRSLGVGSSVPQPRGMLPMRVPGRPLSVAVHASSATGIEADEDGEPKSAATERPALAPPIPVVNEAEIHPVASSSVELVLSPPSPTAALVDLPPLPPSRTSHDSARSHASSRGSTAGGDGYLRDPPRSPRSPRRALAQQQQQQQQRHARRPPPPPPAALDLPTFVDLDFSDVVGGGARRADGSSPTGGPSSGVVPRASWLLSSATDGRDALAHAGTAALSRLSMSSSNGGARSPTLLPVALSRAESDEQYHHQQRAQGGIALTERGSSSRTALVGAEGGAASPTELEGGEAGGEGGAGASPVERVQVVSHRA
ncbi:hypothetical protein JCM9279_006308 [Rhodotorula babjevae]